MPRPRRRGRVRRLDLLVLTKGQRYHLETGCVCVPGAGFGSDRESFEDAWEIHRDTILEEFIAEHPGRRPFAWWLLDHAQERPVVGTWATEREVEALRHDPRRFCKFGFLDTSILGPDEDGELVPLQEPEEDYLARL